MSDDVKHGLFGPGIFGTGIDLSALDEDTAWRLGVFFGEQLAAAEVRGYERAVANLRDDDRWTWMAKAANYLDAMKETTDAN